MSRKRASMRKIKEVLRLATFEHLSERQIALGSNTPKTTVHDYLLRAQEVGLTWCEAEGMDEDTIERLLLPPTNEPQTKRIVPDWQYIHQELCRPHVTLQLLWEEYRHELSNGYSSSQFCELRPNYVRTGPNPQMVGSGIRPGPPSGTGLGVFTLRNAGISSVTSEAM